MRILLVEDDLGLAKGTAKLIQRLGGHQVQVTDNPRVLFEQCYAGAVDLVLMDVNLPEARWQGQQINGAELCRLLKTDRRTYKIPIILITGYALLHEHQMLLETSQANDLYPKPILDYAALLTRISVQVESQPPR